MGDAVSQLLTLTAPPAIGTKLPDFTLKAATKDGIADWKLSAHLGKGPVVIAFYPLAFTGVCTTEVCDLRDNFAALGSLDATVVGLSMDTAPSNKAFAIAQDLPFALLSDPNREVVGKWWPAMPTPLAGVNGTAQRGAMVVNPDGTVKWTSVSLDPKVWVGTAAIKAQL